jgi:SAM-dependent methyltransferase
VTTEVVAVPTGLDGPHVAEPRWRGAGHSTAAGGVVEYRVAKIARSGSIGGRWLDCGCCDGSYTAALVAAGAQVAVGVEIDVGRASGAGAGAAGSASVGAADARFLAGSSERLPFPDGCFDGVLLNEVLEHVGDQDATLAEITRVLRPGGRLVLFSPNRWFPFEGHGMRMGPREIPFPVPLLPWLPRRATASVMQARNYWPGELATLVRGAGLEVQGVDWALPLLSHYRWVPRRIAERYRAAVPRIERSAVLRRFGVSTLVLGLKP